MKRHSVLTSESVTEGHPDKLCDQISDAVLDRYLEQDPLSNLSVECAVSSAILFIAARFQSTARVDVPSVARDVIDRIRYDPEAFDGRTCSILTSLSELPIDENYGLDEKSLSDAELDRIPARSQVTVFGFACTQTPDYMPLPVWLAHRLARRLVEVRDLEILPYLTPDGKTQVGIEFEERRPQRIHSVSVSASQTRSEKDGGPSLARLRDEVRAAVVDHELRELEIKPDARTQIFINPDGPFVRAGPSSHSGLTGRKNGVDTYGEYARNSGSALSGKSPTNIGRAATYAARHAAKNVVAAGLAEQCFVQVSYTIGQSSPVSVEIETYRTAAIPEHEIRSLVVRHVDLRPAAIVSRFNLRHLPSAAIPGGFYRRLAAYGQVGRSDLDLPWERLDLVDVLRRR